VYAEKGKAALTKLVDDDPRTFFKAIVSLCPKQLEAVSPLDGLQDPTLQTFAHMLQAYLQAKQAQATTPRDPSAVAGNDVTVSE